MAKENSPSSLEQFYSEYFDEEYLQELFYDVASELVDIFFVKHQTSNLQYEKDVFAVLENIIFKMLQSDFECDESFYKELTAFIFKKHFKFIFEMIAEQLLVEFANGNKHVSEFLQYYSQDVVVIKAKRYKVPILEAENGLRWHVLSMLSLVKAYVKNKENVDGLKRSLIPIKKKIAAMYKEDLPPDEYNETVDEELEEVQRSIEHNAQKISILRDSIDLEKNKDVLVALKKELEVLLDQRLKIRSFKSKIVAKRVKQFIVLEYQALEKKSKKILQEIESNKKILSQNEASYNSIKKSLAKALYSKKQAL